MLLLGSDDSYSAQAAILERCMCVDMTHVVQAETSAKTAVETLLSDVELQDDMLNEAGDAVHVQTGTGSGAPVPAPVPVVRKIQTLALTFGGTPVFWTRSGRAISATHLCSTASVVCRSA